MITLCHRIEENIYYLLLPSTWQEYKQGYGTILKTIKVKLK